MDIQRTLRGSDDMTSMVDVTFLLLIFFMVTASFVTSKALVTEPAELASVAPDSQPDPVRITVNQYNQVFVEQDGIEELVHTQRELRTAIRSAVGQRDVEAVTIQAHEDSRHRAVVEVCDASRAMGLPKIQINPFK